MKEDWHHIQFLEQCDYVSFLKCFYSDWNPPVKHLATVPDHT